VIAGWAIVGVLAFLVRAVWSLVPHVVGAWRDAGLGIHHHILAGIWIVLMLYSEGYKGFQKAFSPRVVARAVHLARQPHWLYVIIAPAYAMGLVGARTRRMIVSWSVVAAIVAAVLLVRHLHQPWRGVVDSGVVAGLAWGTLSLVIIAGRAACGRVPEVSLDLPETPPPPMGSLVGESPNPPGSP